MVAIDEVIEKKLDAIAVIESQFVEGGVSGHEGLIGQGCEAGGKQGLKMYAERAQLHAMRHANQQSVAKLPYFQDFP